MVSTFHITGSSSFRAIGDSRMSLTGAFLCASTIFSKRAREIESGNSSSISDELGVEHKGLVLAAIMQSVASLESEIYEVLEHGPGHHLGSNGTDLKARQFLKPMIELIDKKDILERYALVLHLLDKKPLVRSNMIWENANLLVQTRNALVHYKSQMNSKVEARKLTKSLKQLAHLTPSFISVHADFFPNKFLGAESAGWAARTALSFLNAFYSNLGFPNRFDYLEAQFKEVLR